MKNALRVLLLLLPASTALADDAAHALDLSLPRAALHANDPPGTWYGDTSGVPASAVAVAVSRCPTSPDGTPSALTGSITTGYGWSSRGGSGDYQAVALNWCRDSDDDAGNSRLFNIQVDVGRSGMDHDVRTDHPAHGGRPPRMR